MAASEPSPFSLGPPRGRSLPHPEKVESVFAETTESVLVPTTESDKLRSTTTASNKKPQLPPLQRPQPTYDEARSIGGPRYSTASGTSTTVTLPPPQRPRPAYAEAKFIAPDLGAGPSILDRLDVLGKALMPRAHDADHFKVVAVDGTNRNAVHLVIASLHYQITKDLKYTVRVVSENSQSTSTDPSAISNFLDHIRNWGLMWAMMLHAPFTGTSSEHPVGPAVHPATSYPYPPVYILPLSPLMATLEASTSNELAHYPQDDLWQWLVGHWAEHRRPDVTVILQENHNNMMDQEVLRIEGDNMRTLLVTNAPDGDIDLTPAQIRRITFEVEEWLYAVN